MKTVIVDVPEKMKKRSNSEMKKITIKISNKELNAMEDFVMCELSHRKEEKFRKITLGQS